MTGWRYGILRPGAANEGWLGPETLGIEVTVPALAAHCGLGNIDPQHDGSCDPRAAIEVALTAPPPPPGAALVTVRADADALGAMAVLRIRAAGRTLPEDSLTRIADIARWDRLERGDWAAWQAANPPLFRPAIAIDLKGKRLELKIVDALVRLDDRTVEARVEALAEWLLAGHTTLPEAAVKAALDHEAALLSAWNRAAITVQRHESGRIAVLRSAPGAPPGGMDLAYRIAPVVVAEGYLPTGRKLTVAQFEPGWIDLPALCAELAAREPGWGGSATIIGSPQGAACALALDAVAGMATARLRPQADRP